MRRPMKVLSQHRRMMERWAIAFSVVTVGLSQVLYGLIVKNPEHFPTSGLFFLYVIATLQLVPILLVVGMDAAFTRLFGQNSVTRVWRTLLYVGVLVLFLRQMQILAVEPIRSWTVNLADNHLVLLVLIGLTLIVAFWYGYRWLNSFFVFLSPRHLKVGFTHPSRCARGAFSSTMWIS